VSSQSRLRSWALGSTGIRALAVVAVAVAVLAAVIAWRARPVVQPLSRPPQSEPAVGLTTNSSPASVIVVAVSGQVNKPGLVRLAAGSRVADALEAAGGALPGTDLATLNLARKVADGELIVVGPAASALPPAVTGTGSGGGAGGAGGLVNLNTATPEQLQTLPGVGPVLASRIIEYRDRTGGFRAVDDLRKVTGIGEARFAELKALVTV
jgi:competence protein ComEA